MYENLYVAGDDVFDTVCVADKDKYCVKDFRFISVISMHKDFTPLDGMLGLAPDDPSNGPSYISALVEQGIVSKKIFGLVYGKSLDSEITLGGWDETWMKSRDDDIHFFDQTNQTRWEIDVRDVKMSGISFWKGNRKAVIDSFIRVISLPKEEFAEFKPFIEGISSNIVCNEKTKICQFDGKCSTKLHKLPEVRLQFSSMKTFAVYPLDYLDDRTEGGKDICVLLIQGTDKDYMHIGQPFLFNVYSIFDLEKKRVGFYLHNSTNSEVENDGVDRPPLQDEPSKFPIWAIILIVLVILGAVFGVGGYLFVRHRNRKLAQNLA